MFLFSLPRVPLCFLIASRIQSFLFFFSVPSLCFSRFFVLCLVCVPFFVVYPDCFTMFFLFFRMFVFVCLSFFVVLVFTLFFLVVFLFPLCLFVSQIVFFVFVSLLCLCLFDCYIAVIKAKPSKTGDWQADSSSALWSFSACARTANSYWCDSVFFVLVWTLGYSSAGNASWPSLHTFTFRVDMDSFSCEVSCHIVRAPVVGLQPRLCCILYLFWGHLVCGEFLMFVKHCSTFDRCAPHTHGHFCHCRHDEQTVRGRFFVQV